MRNGRPIRNEVGYVPISDTSYMSKSIRPGILTVNPTKPNEKEKATSSYATTGGKFMLNTKTIAQTTGTAFLAGALFLTGCAGGPLSTREKGAGIGALGGAATGGIVGAAVGHPGAGAAIGGALGLGTGVLVGDQLQGQENRQADQQRQIDTNQAEIQRQRRDIEKLRRQGEY